MLFVSVFFFEHFKTKVTKEIEEKIKDFFQTEKKSALMITGARQVGKTYCIRELA